MMMLPPYITKTASNAERKLFRILEETSDLEGWHCLHSLGVSRHDSKREGEIDFLLVGPEGIFVLEVKGGRVSRDNGLWKFTDRYGRITTKRESPFDQAKTALYSLRSELVQKFSEDMQRQLFGYAVVLPDIVFSTESPEWDKAFIYDSRDLKAPISEFIARLSGYWQTRQKGSRKLNKEQITKIIAYLRGNFETVRSVSLDIEDSENGLYELTQEQYSALDAMESNRRTIFTGPAGTGKTLLAIEKARRNNAKGIRTLILCFNRLLSLHIGELIKTEKQNYIEVGSLHHFMQQVIRRGGYGDELDQNQESPELFSQIYPDVFIKAWGNKSKYQEIIIDEGQDIISPEYILAIDTMLEGGLMQGSWTIFMDPETQINMFTTFDEDVFKEILQYSASYQLTINCRNTKPIALQTEIISGYPLGKVKKVEGLPVKYMWYADAIEQASLVTGCINKLLTDGIKPEDIVVLSAKRYQASLAGSGRLRLNTGFYQLGKGDRPTYHHDLIGCGSIQAYKGLESSVVILTDIEDLGTKEMNTVNYVGYSRARNALYVSIDNKLKSKYHEQFTKIASAQSKK